MNTSRLVSCLAIVALLGFAACGGGSSPSNPAGSADQAGMSNAVGGFKTSSTAPPVSAEEACPAGLETETVGGVTACVHSNDFVGNCLTKDMLAGKSELVLKMGFLNPDGPYLYNKPALYHTYKATCQPQLEFFGSAVDNIEGFPIAAGNNGLATWTLPLPSDACGTYTFLDTVRDGEGVLFMPLHQSVNTGKDCDMTCRDMKVTLDAVRVGGNPRKGNHKIEFTATWEGKGATATLYKKANRKASETSTASPFVHMWVYSAATYAGGETATLEVAKDGVTCSAQVAIGGGGRVPAP